MKAISVFKKAAIPALVLLLILAMTVSIIPMVSADDASQPKVAANTLAISGDITLVTYFYKSDFEDAEYVTVTVPTQGGDNKTIKTLVADLEVSLSSKGDRYAVKAPLAAAQLTDTVTITWYKDGTAIATYERCAKTDYIDKVFATIENPETPEATVDALKPAVAPLKSLLSYGAMAQTMFNYNTGSMANADLSADYNPTYGMSADNFYDAAANSITFDNSEGTISFINTQVFLQSSIRLSVYFNAPEGAEAYITDDPNCFGDKEKASKVAIHKDSKGYYVNITNIASFNLDKQFYVTVYCGDKSTTASVSVLDSAKKSASDYKAHVSNTFKALYQYYTQTKVYSDNEYKPGPKNQICTHTRTYIDGNDIVCSDCHKSLDKPTLSFKAETIELIKGVKQEVQFTINIAGKNTLQAIIVTPTPMMTDGVTPADGVTLTYKEGSLHVVNAESGLEGTAALNIVLDAKTAMDGCEVVTLTYNVTASESGTYKIRLKTRDAIDANGNAVDGVIASNAEIVVKKPECEEHNYGYEAFANDHRAFCDVCERVFDIENHSFVAEKAVANGKLSINTAVCTVCDAAGANNVHNVYDLGFALDAEDNKTEKAPLFFLTPSEIAAKASKGTRLGAVEMAKDGSYVTIHNKTDITSKETDGHFYLFNGNTEVTGRYLAIKYRTTTTSGSEFFVGANNGNTAAAAGENFYLNTGAVYVNNGEWHVAIFDLAMLKQSHFLPNENGTYTAHHIRWDIFNNMKTDDQSVDIAYVAMSDDVMSLASFDGNDYYRVSTNIDKSSVAIPSYMASTATLNPVADAAWINGATHNGGQTHTVVTDDSGLDHTNIIRKGTSRDSYVVLVSVNNNGSVKHYAHTTDNAHVLAIIYRANTTVSHHEGWVNSTANGGQGGNDQFHSTTNLFGASHCDYEWRIAVVNLDKAFQKDDNSKTHYYDPTIGMTALRFDYWNVNEATDQKDIAEGALIADLAFFGVFESTDDAYAYCGEYLAEHGVDCKHDATTGWQFIDNAGTEYEGTRYAVEAKKCAACGKVTETRMAVVAANFDSIHVDTADGTNGLATWGTSSPTKAGDMSLRVINLYTATSSSKSCAQGDKYPAPSFLRDNKVINGGGWAGINGLFSGTAYYRVLDKSGNVLLDWTAKGNSRKDTNAGADVQAAVNKQIGNNTLHVVSDARRFTMNEIDLSAYASYYQAESSRYENAPITLEYAFQAEGAPEGSDLVMVVKINNIYKNCTSHKMHNVTVEENGKLAVYTECANCGKLESSYTMNIGSKAPNYFIGAADLADRVAADSQVISKTYTLSDDGSYVTVSNIAGKDDGYINIFSGNTTVTGRYMVVKYRTTAGGSWQFYTSSNSATPQAGKGGDTFYLTGTTHDTTNQNKVKGGIISDGNWHYTIVDLAMLSAFKPYDDGTYMAQYFRWDIFDTKHADTKTTDVAFIAFADNIETLKAMDDMVTFQYAFTQYSGRSEAAVLPMSTTVGENNPFFDAYHLAAKGHSYSGTVMYDDKLGNMPYAQFTSTKTTEQFFDVWNNQNYKIAGSGKYIGVLYRAPADSATSFEFFVSSNRSSAIDGCNKSENITRDNQWRFVYVDISTLKTSDGAYWYKDSDGLGHLRFDVLNGGMSATATIDIGFLGFFDSQEDMAATLTAYNELYGLSIPTTPLLID